MIKLTLRCYATSMLLVGLGLSPALYAHLLPPQQGKLTFVQDGAFMAMSLPVSAFEGIDEDKNGSVSTDEFNNHRTEIIKKIRAGIVLSEKGEDRSLEGIMLSPVSSEEHDEHGKALEDNDVERVYVMGKFFLKGPGSDLRFRNSLYGKLSSERTFKIYATKKDGGGNQKFELTPSVSTAALFAKK